MKVFYRVILFLFLSTVLMYPLPAGPSTGRQVITHQQIQQAGLNRLADIFTLVDSWDTYTIDGFTWYAAANQLSGYDTQSWTVLIDGHELRSSNYGVNNLNALPLSIDLVDSVIVISEPQIYRGYFTDRGLIHFFTKEAPKGFSYQGRFMFGNESGDPGPYRYTPYRTPNVDRIGADGSNYVALNNQYLALSYNYLQQVYYPTDVRILERNRRMGAGNYPRIDVDTYYLKGGLTLAGGEQTFYLSNSTSRDHRPFDYLLQEVPVISSNLQSGIQGPLWNGKNLQMNYYLDYADNAIRDRENLFQLEFDWRLRHTGGGVRAVYQARSLTTTVGLGMEEVRAQTGSYFNHAYRKAWAFSSLAYPLGKERFAKLDLYLLRVHNRYAFKTSLQTRLLKSADQQAFLNLSYSKKLLQEENPYWKIENAFYRFNSDQFAYFFIIPLSDETSQTTIDGQWQYRFHPRAFLQANLKYRFLKQYRYTMAPFDHGLDIFPRNAYRRVLAGQDGHIVGIGLSLRHNLAEALKQELLYNYNECVAGDQGLQDYWRRFPRHKARYQLTWNPLPGFAVWSGLQFLSKTFWFEYEISPTKNAGLDDMILWDVSIEKWFWQRRVRANLIFRNMLNDQAVYHPAGAALDLRYYVQMELHLDSLIPLEGGFFPISKAVKLQKPNSK
jgi:hypothetical protein